MKDWALYGTEHCRNPGTDANFDGTANSLVTKNSSTGVFGTQSNLNKRHMMRRTTTDI